MNILKQFITTTCLVLGLIITVNQDVQCEKLKLFGDVRIRAEHDYNSKKNDASFRNDRTRARYRLRFGFGYQWNDNISFGGRLRSGNPKDQQSPHISFGNEMEASPINIDKVFIKGKYDKFWWQVGKNSFPFWQQNEMFWDGDVNPEGLALGGNIKLGEFHFKPTIGGFLINSSSKYLGNDSKLIAGQLAINGKISEVKIDFASGIFIFDKIAIKNDGASAEQIDYNILQNSLKLSYDIGLPLSLGFDYMLNLSDYDNDLKDEKSGYVASLKLGSLKKSGDFLIAYYYAHIEKYAVVDYFAQDDWVRWNYSDGDGKGLSGARSSNFSGHELRLAYAFGTGFNCVLRGYFVEAIAKNNNASNTKLETANRIRLDFNIKF